MIDGGTFQEPDPLLMMQYLSFDEYFHGQSSTIIKPPSSSPPPAPVAAAAAAVLSTMVVPTAFVVAVVTVVTSFCNVVGNQKLIVVGFSPATSHGHHHYYSQNGHLYSHRSGVGGRANTFLKLTSTGISSDDGVPTTTTTNPPSCQVVFEYCTGCRWMLKSFWYAQELLSTFSKTDGLDAVTVLPSTDDKSGIFVVRLVESSTDLNEEEDGDGGKRPKMMELWDRHTMSGFPQPKDIKQKIRDVIDPNKYLGHSDTEENKTQQQQQHHPQGEQETSKVKMSNEVIDLSSSSSSSSSSSGSSPPATTRIKLDPEYTPSPSVVITYCTGCQWLLRAAYLGQELLTTFNDGQIASVTLVPSRPPAKGGQFTVELDGRMLFDRTVEGRFPEVKEIKQLLRDQIVPDMDLGHSDNKIKKDGEVEDELDDDEAMEARKYFGVM